MKEILTDWNQFINLLSKHSLDKWDARCKDAAEKTVEQGKVPEAMQEKLKNGCFDLMHRHDGLDALKEYAKDRQQIIEKEHNVKLNLNYD